MKDFVGKVALVTGGGSGIGRSLAVALARAGAKVAVSGTTPETLDETVAIIARTGGQAMAVPFDVADPAAWSPALDAIARAFGPVRLLCLNAGVGSGRGQVEAVPIEAWRSVIEINLGGPFYGLRAWLPEARASGEEGHILFTGSINGLIALPGANAYGVSKAGLWSLAEMIRHDLQGSAIGVSIMHPGTVRTNILDSIDRHVPGVAGDPTRAGTAAHIAGGYDPDWVAQRSLAGIRDGEFHICTHLELRDRIAERFAAVIDAMDDATPDGALSVPSRA